MAKITNLKGTTWRFAYRYDGIIADYGVFSVSGTAHYYDDQQYGIVVSIDGTFNSMYAGYGLSDNVPFAQANSIVIGGEFVTQLGDEVTNDPYASINVPIELTFTGGTDISNPLFIDFINTYGTLVSGGEPPTAEGVKSKLQSLITASNAKTGKSDANLTDAVKTLLEGYGQGITPSGSLDITENGTFDVTDKASVNVNVADNPLPIEVSTEAEMNALLETAEVGSVYKYTGETGTYENGALYVVEESE